MTKITLTSSQFPDNTWEIDIKEGEEDKLEVWDAAFNILKDMLFELSTGKGIVTAMLEKFDRLKQKEGIRD